MRKSTKSHKNINFLAENQKRNATTRPLYTLHKRHLYTASYGALYSPTVRNAGNHYTERGMINIFLPTQ